MTPSQFKMWQERRYEIAMRVLANQTIKDVENAVRTADALIRKLVKTNVEFLQELQEIPEINLMG